MRQRERPLIREASIWFARMHGPDAPAHEPRFAAWIAGDEAHREAYSRVSEAFSLGKALKPGVWSIASRRKRLGGRLATIAAILSAGFCGIIFAVSQNIFFPVRHAPAIVMTNRWSTGIGEIRNLALSDGSNVTLDTQSELVVRFETDRRYLRLIRGRARFDVAHERRAFVVQAGDGTVTAHGTIFDVRVEGPVASVHLLRGAIDVGLPKQNGEAARIRQVRPGEAVAFDARRGITPVKTSQDTMIVQTIWPSSLLEFDNARVGEVVAEANRYSSRQLRVGSPDIAGKRVSGTFRVGDTEQLAGHLASLLGVQISRRPNGDIDMIEVSPGVDSH